MHDAKGRQLHKDDVVLVPMKIVNLFQTEEYCNVDLMSLFGRRPDGAKERWCAVNTGVVLLADQTKASQMVYVEQGAT